MVMPEYIISLSWDSEVAVWIATSGDIPGLILESGSFDALIERVRFAVPELLELSGITQETLSMCFRSERHEEVRL
ncbi:antitoxin HicB [Synergistales bacterium]|nr:antitoxin HicB [Synergistales bacterium]